MAPTPVKPTRRTPTAVEVGDYYTDGAKLWLIRDLNGEGVFAEDCKTTDVHYRDFRWLRDLKLVKPRA